VEDVKRHGPLIESRRNLMIITQLLQHLGLPAGLATAVGIAAMRLKRGVGANHRSARRGRSQRPPQDHY
jgi:hypothetical protein